MDRSEMKRLLQSYEFDFLIVEAQMKRTHGKQLELWTKLHRELEDKITDLILLIGDDGGGE